MIVALLGIQKMQHYCADVGKYVFEHLESVLQDWAAAKTVSFELDATITAEKEKVRTILETKIIALTKEKMLLSGVCTKHEQRIGQLEILERELIACKATLERSQQDNANLKLHLSKQDQAMKDISAQLAERTTYSSEQTQKILEMQHELQLRDGTIEKLNKVIQDRLNDLKEHDLLHDVTRKDRDHFQVCLNNNCFCKFNVHLVLFKEKHCD